LPPITDALAINGPGAAQLTVRRDTGGDYRIFALMVNAPGVVTISGLNITAWRVEAFLMTSAAAPQISPRGRQIFPTAF